MMRPSEELFKLCADVRYRIIGKEAVIVRLKVGKVLALNEVGARILQLIDGDWRLGEIVATVEQEYEVGADELEADVCRLVEELLGAGIVEEVTGS